MNCQEYRNLIEDTLDVSLHGEPERRVRLHIEHCAACRSYFQSRRNEHIAFFSKINASCADLRLPDGFADRLAASVRARQSVRRGWRRLSLPRWALIAASLVVVVGFVFANVKLIMENVELEGGESEGTEATGATAFGVAEYGLTVPSVSYVVSLSSDAFESTTDTKLETNQGEMEMRNVKTTAVAIAAATLAASPTSAASCIVSGSTDRSAQVEMTQTSNSGVNTFAAPEVCLCGLNLRSDDSVGMLIIFK